MDAVFFVNVTEFLTVNSHACLNTNDKLAATYLRVVSEQK